MAITNKNCFFKGFLTGQSIREGYTRLPGDGTPYGPNTALSGTADYDKESFLCGLAAGLAARGRIRRGAPTPARINTRLSTTDELLCELYLLDSKGLLSVPKLPGMTALQQWMQENDFTDPEEYADKREEYGDDIAWDFYRKSYAMAQYDDSDLPIDVTKLIAGLSSIRASSWYHCFLISDAADGFTAPLRVTGGTGWRQAVGTTTSYTQIAAFCRMPMSIPAYRMPSGTYKLSVTSAFINPAPSDLGGCKQGIDIVDGIDRVIDQSSGVMRQGPPSLDPYTLFVPNGEWVIFHYSENNPVSMDCVFSQSRFRWHPLPDHDVSLNVVHVQANAETTQRVEYHLELIERDHEPLHENATISQVMRAADKTGLYFLSTDEGTTLKPCLVLDQEKKWVRDFSRIRAYEIDKYGGMRYSTDTATQTLGENSITARADVTEDGYIETFTEYDSSFVEQTNDYPVGNAAVRFRPSNSCVEVRSKFPGLLGFILTKDMYFDVYRREDP